MAQLPPQASVTHWLDRLQVWPALQVPPQGSFEAWHTLEALQVVPEPQVPQLSVPPQPSLIEPQVLPWAAQVVAVQLPPPPPISR